jgi:hypothetical protein
LTTDRHLARRRATVKNATGSSIAHLITDVLPISGRSLAFQFLLLISWLFIISTERIRGFRYPICGNAWEKSIARLAALTGYLPFD